MTRHSLLFDVLRPAALLFSLYLVFRALFLEPFGVPTGSMADALLGVHRAAACEACGATVRVGAGTRARPGRPASVRCPNCDHPVRLEDLPDLAGDRLMLDKCVFELRPPRRWEPAVFVCPVDDSKPYVKRVVGLPGESILIRDGDVFAGGARLRKELWQARETRVLLFDLAHAPPGGWGPRFVTANDRPAPPSRFRDGALIVDDPDGSGVGLTYRNWSPSRDAEDVLRDWVAYNGPPPEPSRTRPLDVATPPVHDFFFECEAEFGGAGTLALRLGDGADHVTADVPFGKPGAPTLAARSETGVDGPAATGAALTLRPGVRYRLEFAFVDRRATVAVDGTVLVSLDLPEPAGPRGALSRPLQLGVRGGSAVLRNLRLWRDVHYRSDGRWATDAECRLGADEYFVLGDNAADSHDSREWAVPGVRRAALLGKPFLRHRPGAGFALLR